MRLKAFQPLETRANNTTGQSDAACDDDGLEIGCEGLQQGQTAAIGGLRVWRLENEPSMKKFISSTVAKTWIARADPRFRQNCWLARKPIDKSVMRPTDSCQMGNIHSATMCTVPLMGILADP